MQNFLRRMAVMAVVMLPGICATAQMTTPALVGAWRGPVQFTTGAFAAVKDLQFMYVFHADGTMTESSNYDGCPPAPPAYGAWRQTGPRTFEAKYEFFTPKPSAALDELLKGGGWTPDGHGALTQTFMVAADGRSFAGTITLALFDPAGKPREGGSPGSASGRRIGF